MTFNPADIADSTDRAVLARGEFSDAERARLADIARDPMARRKFDRVVGSQMLREPESMTVDEIVVGGGLHAAIYAATLYARTGRTAVVLDPRLGGAFAYNDEVFYLNSRNRGADLGLPGTGEGLNVIPNGVMQPADIDGAEYQTNLEFAFAIRATLAMRARPYAQVVTYIERLLTDEPQKYFICTNVGAWRTNRVVLATGVGAPRMLPGQDPGMFTFEEFMSVMASERTFPLRGWKNVAVIGAGESGNSVIEALVGQGPIRGGPASLDTVENITWFGQQCETKEEFEGYDSPGARSRYAGIGRFFPRDDDPSYYHRIQPVPSKVERLADTDEGTRVYARNRLSYGPFDHVVVCVGFENRVNDLVRTSVDDFLTEAEWGMYPLREEIVRDTDGTQIARRFANTEIYKVGPCAELPVTRAERERAPVLERIPTNSASCFRYALRTRRLAELHADAALGAGAGGYVPAPNSARKDKLQALREKVRFENGR